jgi:hypothetical protein
MRLWWKGKASFLFSLFSIRPVCDYATSETHLLGKDHREIESREINVKKQLVRPLYFSLQENDAELS